MLAGVARQRKIGAGKYGRCYVHYFAPSSALPSQLHCFYWPQQHRVIGVIGLCVAGTCGAASLGHTALYMHFAREKPFEIVGFGA